MSENTSSIKPKVAESGFFTKTGRLKSNEELKEKVEVNVEEEAASTSGSEVVTKALTKVEDKFRDEVSEVANDINRRSSQLKQVKQSLRKEKETLQDLKQAFSDGDEQKKAELTEEIQLIRGEREKNIEQINEEQRLSSETRNIRLGNKEIASINLPKLELSEVESKAPQSIEEIKSQIGSINEEIGSLDSQREGIRSARKDVAEALSSGRSEIDKISENSLKSLEAAQQSASKISTETKSLTKDELISAVAAKINPVSVAFALRS